MEEEKEERKMGLRNIGGDRSGEGLGKEDGKEEKRSIV